MATEEIQTLLTSPAGAAFRKIDLHVHTPASPDVHDHCAGRTPADVVQAALGAGLDAIVVADHNTVAWCDEVREAAEESGLVVFPGAEISTSEGHLVAVFDPQAPTSTVRELLIRAGISESSFGDTEVISSMRIDDLAKATVEAGGLAIAAHIDREKGFWQVMRSSAVRRKAIHSCGSIAAFEVVDLNVGRDVCNGALGGYTRQVACVQGSDSFPEGGDAHCIDAIGRRLTYVKLGSFTLRALRQAFLDPELRVRLVSDAIPTQPVAIEGLTVTGGFLGGEVFRFSPDLNCLIGGTGVGKSLTLELLRFALDQQLDGSLLPAIGKEVDERLRFALGDEAAVRLVLRKGDDLYAVDRAWQGVRGADPVVSRWDGSDLDPLDDVHVPSFFPIKAFSQSEVIEYSREPLARLSLVDDLIDAASEKRFIAAAISGLRENAVALLEQRHLKAQFEQETARIPGLREEIEGLEKFFDQEVVRQQETWEAEADFLDKVADTISSAIVETASALGDLPLLQLEDDDHPANQQNPDLIARVIGIAERYDKAVVELRDAAATALGDIDRDMKRISDEWKSKHDAAEAEFRVLLASLGGSDVGKASLHAKLSALRDRERELRRVERGLSERILPKVRELENAREALLSNLQNARRALREKRRAKAQDLSDHLENRVRISIGKFGDTRASLEALKELRAGSRVQEQDLQEMAKKLHPVPFVKSMLAEDWQTLEGLSGVSADRFQRLYDNLAESRRIDELYEYQLTVPEDVVRIQFAVESDEYRDIEALAHGQKCTVVLMISLAEGSSPLIVDQPEDALHAPWIEEYIVSTLRRDRGTRQCIFASKSPSILVSADAEQVIAMSADANHGKVEKTGSIDDFDARDRILYHAEGGPDPFIRRQTKYDL